METDEAYKATAAIEQLKKELRREHELYLRALADFDNYRRRVERELANAARAAKREIILLLLDVIDNFERALDRVNQAPQSAFEEMRAIRQQILRLLELQGVTPFESLGRAFDPWLHEAVGMVESQEHEPGFILDELRRGYRWGEEVLRPARVRVAR
jgi:molecular chaperone GrpE